MRPAGPDRSAADVWDIAIPSRPGLMAGVSMAGFRARAKDPVDLRVVPYPAVTMFIDLSAPPGWSVSTTRHTAWPQGTAPPSSRPKAAMPTSPISTGTS